MTICGVIAAAVPSPHEVHAAGSSTSVVQEVEETAPQEKLFAVARTADVSIYAGDSDSSQVISNGNVGDSFQVNRTEADGWTEISVGDTTGYLMPESTVKFVTAGAVADTSITAKEEEAEAQAEAAAAAQAAAEAAAAQQQIDANQALRQQVVDFAMQYLGGRYIWGGEDPNVGADCSGFTKYVMAHAAGVSLNRTAAEQAEQGTEITADQLQPGDLLFYTSGSATDPEIGIGHVAIYIGDGKVIHSSNEKNGIRISDWDYRTPLKMVNVLG